MPALGLYFSHATTPDSSSGYPYLVTPSDTGTLPFLTRSFTVAVSGTVAILSEHGETLILPAMPNGFEWPIHAQQILATGTTATGIVALF